jgi:Ulp1 family protease
MHITGADLLSLKSSGPMSERIIINYLNYLIASNIINSSIHIFSFAFISNLMNSHQSDTEISMERFVLNIKKNYDALKSKIMINIFDFDDVVVPIRSGNHFSSIIIHNIRSYEQKKIQSCLVYCDSKDMVIPDIVEAIRL